MNVFTCPECGDNRLEEIMCDITQACDVIGFENGDIIYGPCVHVDGKFCRYQCVQCGWILPVALPQDLKGYLDSLLSSSSQIEADPTQGRFLAARNK